jgi:hypothetical protein
VQVIERLEPRALLSGFNAAGATLDVDLNVANKNVAIVSNGTSYTLTLTGDTWSGTDNANDRVVPTHAGGNRRVDFATIAKRSCPHTRGGEPLFFLHHARHP